MHKYCITKDLFESEVIITIPKVKTHQKAGITNALKILVGINGDKDFLPHHRKGSEKNGGDCYPGKNILLGLSENVIDEANRHRGNWMYKPLVYLSLLFWKFSLPSPKHNLGAAWHGNDTTWRMTLDLNLIAGYGRNDGTFADNPQRVIYSLSDGIIGGQGDGPLNADPLPLGIICFSNSAAKADAVIATFMGFQINKIPLIFNALKKETIENSAIILNGVPISIDDLKNISIKTTPPPGWLDYL
jgi:hypothetical protein